MTTTAAEVSASDRTEIGVSLRGVTKEFGSLTAVKDLNIDIHSGEFFSMLGPSGSGKTTVLRMIAGFEAPTSGTISLLGQDVTAQAPFDRQVNTVFQDYALFPHLTVVDNVEYGLKVNGISKSKRRAQALEALEQVRLAHVADRLPSQLSGGQRQRIALARALILKPKVLLLDEPLGALDKQLREQMQIELKQIQREVGITFIFVTHDQEEALSLSDRVAVYNEGRIEQVGTPAEVYQFPRTEFVASFLGVTNLLNEEASRTYLGIDGVHSLRPEYLRVSAPESATGTGLVTVPGTISEVVYTGPHTRLVIATEDDHKFIAEIQNNAQPGISSGDARGTTVHVQFDRSHAVPIAPAK